MKAWKQIVPGLAFSTILASGVLAAQISPPQSGANSTEKGRVAPEFDCRAAGNEVSALIDAAAGNRNLPAARSTFQVGVMDCMDGDIQEANKRFQEVRKLLASELSAPMKTTRR